MGTGDDPRTIVVIVHDGVDLVSVELVSGRPDLALVEALARLQLAALRIGCSISIRDACPELCGLLDLVGLATVLPSELAREGGPDLPAPSDLSAFEARGQAERREEPGVEEVVELGDPSV